MATVLLAPNALASVEPNDPTLWDEFVTWVDAQIAASNGVTADQDTFSIWLLSRLTVPGG